jgi:hypothetical protein
MKKILSITLCAATAALMAQPVKKGKGYYCNLKGDTVRGEIGVNSEDVTEAYKGFSFKVGAGKLAPMSSKKAKAYGYEGRNYTLIPFDAGEVYIEYLAKGRLNFMEYKFMGTVNGEPGIENVYFIQDTRPDEKTPELKELKQISQKFYKKDIKPYMKDQTMIWTDLDKFTFNREAIINAIKEFNKFYEAPAQE